MTKKPHGSVLIINVMNVLGEKARLGTDHDRNNLRDMFQIFDFKTAVYNDSDDLTAEVNSQNINSIASCTYFAS
jgi:hypothetical protein